jgi:hypothetical protein
MTSKILITGCYRTGSEYFTQLLGNHPRIESTMYALNFMRYYYSRYNPIQENNNHIRLITKAAERSRIRWGLKINTNSVIDRVESHEKVTYGCIYNELMREVVPISANGSWAEKTQLVWTKIPDFLDMFSQGKTIQMIRDPRNVLASFKKFTYADPPSYLGAVFNCYSSMKLGLRYQKKFSPDEYSTVKFENILTSPEETITSLFEQFNFSADHDLLSRDNWTYPDGSSWGPNTAFDDGENGFDQSRALERWKENLSQWEVALTEVITRDLLREYGYELINFDVDWERILKPLMSDDQLLGFFRDWLLEQRGAEEFPTDPMKEKNWSENQ